MKKYKNILLSLIVSLELHAIFLLYFFDIKAEKYAVSSRPEFMQVNLNYIESKNIESADFDSTYSSSKKTMIQGSNPVVEEKIIITPDKKISGYFKNSELDAGPKPIGEIVVPLPDNNSNEVRGYVILEVYINALGGVDRVEELYRNVPYEYAQSAIRTFSRALFFPGKKDGNNQPAMMKIQVDFLGNEAEPIRSE